MTTTDTTTEQTAAPLDLDAIAARKQAADVPALVAWARHLQREWDQLVNERVDLLTEVRRLTERLAVDGELVEAVRAWAVALEDAPGSTILLGQPHSDLYDAAEQHRLLTMALDSAEQPDPQ